MSSTNMSVSSFISLSVSVFMVVLMNIIIYGGIIYLFVLLIKALRKYLKSSSSHGEDAQCPKSLSKTLREHRNRCHMTQEFVAEHLDVSRQAVSKWENGTSSPSTTNLQALAKLYDISPEVLLNAISKSQLPNGQ